MESSKKFDFISQPTDTGNMDINFCDSSRKQSYSQPSLQNINSALVDFMGETFPNCSYYSNNETQQSSVDNEDEEQSSCLSLPRPADEFVKRCDEKITSAIVQDIEIMFDKYKELGNELERNLVSLGDKHTEQRHQLSQHIQNYEFLIKQKERNKKSLVQLQIEVENLDAMRQRASNDCQIDKKNKSENIGQLFQTLFANNEYIKSTQNKFTEVLSNDKNKLDSLLLEIKSEIKNQNQLSYNYSQAMQDVYIRYENFVKKLSEEELDVDFNIEDVIQQCQISKGLKEEKQNDLNKITTNFQELQSSIEEQSKAKEELQNTLAKNEHENNEQRAHFCKILGQIHNEKRTANEVYTVKCEKAKTQNEEKILNENLVSEMSKENSKLVNVLDKILIEKQTLSKELNEKEINIFELRIEKENALECQTLKSSLNELIKREQYLLDKKVDIEKNIDLKLKEQEKIKAFTEECQTFFIDIEQKVSQEKQLKLELETVFETTNTEMENTKTKLISSILSDKLTISEKRLNEIESIYNRHTKKLSELISEEKYLDKAITYINSEMEDIVREQTVLEQKEKNLLLEEEKQQRHLLSLENLKHYLEDLEENYIKSFTAEETHLSLDKLKEELENKIIEYERQENFNNVQLNSISDSFKFQVQNLNEQMRLFKSEKDETIKKKINHNTKYLKAIPSLEENVITYKNLISEKLPSIIECIDTRIEYINKLLETYKKACIQVKNKTHKNVEAQILISSIEKELICTIEHMNAICEGPKLVASDNLIKFNQINTNVKNKYFNLLSNIKGLPTINTIRKLTEIAVALYGGLGLLPKTSLNDTLLSSPRTVTSDEISVPKQ